MARRPAPALHDPQDLLRGATYFLVRSAFSSDAAIAEYAGVDRSRITRFKQGDSLEPHTDALLDSVGVTVSQLRGFLDDAVIPEWLRGSNAHLAFRAPLDVLKRGRLSEVIAAIESEKAGAYA